MTCREKRKLRRYTRCSILSHYSFKFYVTLNCFNLNKIRNLLEKTIKIIFFCRNRVGSHVKLPCAGGKKSIEFDLSAPFFPKRKIELKKKVNLFIRLSGLFATIWATICEDFGPSENNLFFFLKNSEK